MYFKTWTCLFVYLRATEQSWQGSHDTWDETALIRQLSLYLAPKALVKIPSKHDLLSWHRKHQGNADQTQKNIKHFKDILILEETISM